MPGAFKQRVPILVGGAQFRIENFSSLDMEATNVRRWISLCVDTCALSPFQTAEQESKSTGQMNTEVIEERSAPVPKMHWFSCSEILSEKLESYDETLLLKIHAAADLSCLRMCRYWSCGPTLSLNWLKYPGSTEHALCFCTLICRTVTSSAPARIPCPIWRPGDTPGCYSSALPEKAIANNVASSARDLHLVWHPGDIPGCNFFVFLIKAVANIFASSARDPHSVWHPGDIPGCDFTPSILQSLRHLGLQLLTLLNESHGNIIGGACNLHTVIKYLVSWRPGACVAAQSTASMHRYPRWHTPLHVDIIRFSQSQDTSIHNMNILNMKLPNMNVNILQMRLLNMNILNMKLLNMNILDHTLSCTWILTFAIAQYNHPEREYPTHRHPRSRTVLQHVDIHIRNRKVWTSWIWKSYKSISWI